MRTRLGTYWAAAAVAGLIACHSTSAVAQNGIVWEKDGWRVQTLISATTALGCQAIKGFSSTHDTRRSAAWGFISTVNGRWGLAMIGVAADRMAGKSVTITVDNQVLSVAVPRRLPNGITIIGQLPADRMGVIATGRSLTFTVAATSARFSLDGANAALAAASRCANAVREAAARAPGGVLPDGRGATKDRASGISAGTGFYVSKTGDILTNAHVVQGCSTVGIKGYGDASFREARVKASDTTQDLALIEPSAAKYPPALLTWRRETRLGEQIAIFGFPYLGTLASSGTFTRGDVTALAGLNNNSTHFQLSAPVQPGNSGGPVVDEQGHVVGVVVAKLNALAVARVRGDIPQNVNFAIKSARAISFLETNGVAIALGGTSAPRLSGPDLAERLRDGAVLVTCTSGGSPSAGSASSTKNVGR